MAENQYDFPTEVLALPSKGLLYPEDSPLRSGNIDVKYMTAREEDILTSTKLIEKGLVIDRLLESVIADDKVKLDDLLIGDKNALMVASRVLGYGKDYEFETNCPACGERNKDNIDLTSLKDKEIDHSVFKNGINEFGFDLPSSKRKITYKILTQLDEREIDAELKALKKISGGSNVDPEITTRLKKAILSVDGKSDITYVNNFVENEFLSRDTMAFRRHVISITPDLDMETEVTLSNGERRKVSVPMTVTFLWPDASI